MQGECAWCDRWIDEHGWDADHLIKVVLVGEERVGKTSLMRRLTQNEFHEQYLTTIGVDMEIHRSCVDDSRIKVRFGIRVFLIFFCQLFGIR